MLSSFTVEPLPLPINDTVIRSEVSVSLLSTTSVESNIIRRIGVQSGLVSYVRAKNRTNEKGQFEHGRSRLEQHPLFQLASTAK